MFIFTVSVMHESEIFKYQSTLISAYNIKIYDSIMTLRLQREEKASEVEAKGGHSALAEVCKVS